MLSRNVLHAVAVLVYLSGIRAPLRQQANPVSVLAEYRVLQRIVVATVQRVWVGFIVPCPGSPVLNKPAKGGRCSFPERSLHPSLSRKNSEGRVMGIV